MYSCIIRILNTKQWLLPIPMLVACGWSEQTVAVLQTTEEVCIHVSISESLNYSTHVQGKIQTISYL